MSNRLVSSMDPVQKDVFSNLFYHCFRSDYCVAILKFNCSYSFFGVFDLQVLYGRVASRGYHFEPGAYEENRFIPIAAPCALGPPIQVFADDSIPAPKFVAHRVKWRLSQVTQYADSIAESVEEGDSVLLFRFSVPNSVSFIRELYGMAFFVPQTLVGFTFINSFCCILNSFNGGLYDEPTNVNIMKFINRVSKFRQQKQSNAVMIIGGKNVGKSTLCRLVANNFIQKNASPVYLLDCDVGQPEMNPSGCVSLVKLESPLLGVPALQQRKNFSHSFFYGSISPEQDIESYLMLVQKLLNYFYAEAPHGSSLIVNTLGWIEGQGAYILDRLIIMISPCAVFHLIKSEQNYKVNVVANSNFVIYEGNTNQHLRCKNFDIELNASALRSLLVTGYLAPVCPLPMLSSIINAVPFAVSFKRIALCFHGYADFTDEQIFTVLNCALVALCVADVSAELKKARRLFDDEDMPIMLHRKCSPFKIVGFGLIRAIDVEKCLFYVTTPVEYSIIKKVEVFVRGLNIDVPPCFFLSQKARGAPYLLPNQHSSVVGDLFRSLNLKTKFKKRKPWMSRGKKIRRV